MHRIATMVGAVLFLGAVMALALVSGTPASGSSQSGGAPQSQVADAVPAFHAEPPKGELPETMSPELFNQTIVQNAYAVAAKIKKTLYQQPCYCHCDKSKGHTSLLDCFTSNHGSGCGMCIYEDFYSYEQANKGKTAAQIREGIIKGEWKTVDARKYQESLPAK